MLTAIWKPLLLARETDMEVEAIALSRLGSVYDKILKDKIHAKTYFRRSIQLAMSLHPRTFDNEGNCETNFISGFSINPFVPNAPFPYPQFSDAFRG